METKADNQPLVSVVVITYNSAQLVLETLESVKKQTYKNVELIVSDDASTDDTVKICREWLGRNKDRFVRTELIESKINTGVSGNCNRGLNECMGEWFKYVAGDDILLPNCIEDYVQFVSSNKEASFAFSNAYQINTKGEIIKVIVPNRNVVDGNLKKQMKRSLLGMMAPAVSFFMKLHALQAIGGFDENVPFFEDHALQLSVVKNGYVFYYLPKFTVMKRKHSSSITQKLSHNKLTSFHQKMYSKSFVNFFSEDYFSQLLEFKMFRKYFHATVVKHKHLAILKNEYSKSKLIDKLQYLDPIFLMRTVLSHIKSMLIRFMNLLNF